MNFAHSVTALDRSARGVEVLGEHLLRDALDRLQQVGEPSGFAVGRGADVRILQRARLFEVSSIVAMSGRRVTNHHRARVFESLSVVLGGDGDRVCRLESTLDGGSRSVRRSPLGRSGDYSHTQKRGR